MSVKSLTPLEQYHKLHNALPRIVIISGLMIIILYLFAYFGLWPCNKFGITWPFEAMEIRRLLFLSYMCILGGMWITYFLSRWKKEDVQANTLKIIVQFFQVKSLRRFLAETSMHWQEDANSKDLDQIIESHHRKSLSSMAVLALMVAASILVLSEVRQIVHAAWHGTDLWGKSLLLGAATTSITAIICFIISIDALDTLFNKFKVDELKIKQYFYRQSLNPKYFGFLLVIISIVFIAAYHNLIFACVLLGIVLFVGYAHWFPNVETGESKLQAFTIGALLISLALGVELYLHNMLPTYFYALLSALLWALAAPIINKGLNNIPDDVKVPGILVGLLVSLLSGSLFLFIFLFPHLSFEKISIFLVLAGIFTFPVATGLYYLCGNAYEGKMEVAAQFSRVKPIFSVLFAAFLLREALSFSSYLSLLLISIGVVFLVIGSLRGTFRRVAILLGILTALSWSLGELFIKRGLTESGSIIDTFVALLAGTVILIFFFVFWSPFPALKKHKGQITSWIPSFIAHGVLSFGLAYVAFFESIKRIGLGHTVLINAFWPILAIFFVYLGFWVKGEKFELPKFIWLAAIFLLMGSVLQVLVDF